MPRIALAMSVLLFAVSPAFADTIPHAHPPTSPQPKAVTTVTLKDNSLILTFGPIDLPTGHSGELASSMPIHFFKAPPDMHVIGYKSRIFTKDGKVIAMFPRASLEGRYPQEVAAALVQAFDAHCSKPGPSIPPEQFAKLGHAKVCGSQIPRMG